MNIWFGWLLQIEILRRNITNEEMKRKMVNAANDELKKQISDQMERYVTISEDLFIRHRMHFVQFRTWWKQDLACSEREGSKRAQLTRWARIERRRMGMWGGGVPSHRVRVGLRGGSSRIFFYFFLS